MKTVVVTGANGFIGQHLCSELVTGGREVRAVVRRDEAIQELPPGVVAFVVTLAEIYWLPTAQ